MKIRNGRRGRSHEVKIVASRYALDLIKPDGRIVNVYGSQREMIALAVRILEGQPALDLADCEQVQLLARMVLAGSLEKAPKTPDTVPLRQ